MRPLGPERGRFSSFVAGRARSYPARPTVTISSKRISQQTETPHEIGFKIDDQHQVVWHITSVRARYIWRPLISEIGSRQPDGGGGTKSVTPRGWKRRIHFDPPTHSSTILLPYDCPSLIVLVFELAMRSSTNETSQFSTRVKIKD